MTSRATKAVPAADSATATPEWGKVNLHGRDVVFVMPSPEQLMVLRRLARQLDSEQAPARQLTIMAKILDAVSACMATDDDRDYVDQLVLDRKVDITELAPLIQMALLGEQGVKATAAPATGPKPRVRRR